MMSCAAAAGVPPVIIPPRSARRALIAGSFSHALVSWFSLAMISAGVCDELRNRFGRHGRMHRHHEWRTADHRNGRGVAGKIEAQIVIQRRIDDIPSLDQQQCIAIWISAECHLGTDVAAGTWAV